MAHPKAGAECGSPLDLGFKGAAELLRNWRDGRTPDPELMVSRCADSHRC